MDNQHKQIKGYRDLTQEELNAINQVKALESSIAQVYHVLRNLPGVDGRDMALARTAWEDGCIRAVRAIAKPVSPFN